MFESIKLQNRVFELENRVNHLERSVVVEQSTTEFWRLEYDRLRKFICSGIENGWYQGERLKKADDALKVSSMLSKESCIGKVHAAQV